MVATASLVYTPLSQFPNALMSDALAVSGFGKVSPEIPHRVLVVVMRQALPIDLAPAALISSRASVATFPSMVRSNLSAVQRRVCVLHRFLQQILKSQVFLNRRTNSFRSEFCQTSGTEARWVKEEVQIFPSCGRTPLFESITALRDLKRSLSVASFESCWIRIPLLVPTSSSLSRPKYR